MEFSDFPHCFPILPNNSWLISQGPHATPKRHVFSHTDDAHLAKKKQGLVLLSTLHLYTLMGANVFVKQLAGSSHNYQKPTFYIFFHLLALNPES